jgi:hypothetical protein
MLEVQKFLNRETANYGVGDEQRKGEHALAMLKEAYGIKANIWKGQLVCLNYCQIESPKTHPITIESRSLVLEFGSWEVISRSFSRFFNLGEIGEVNEEWVPCPTKGVSRFRTMTFHEKMDGSLIGIFTYKNQLLYRTRSLIMPEGDINGTGTTWKEAIESCLPISWRPPYSSALDVTLICELTCRENRVVVKYDAKPDLTLLAIRGRDGKYHDAETATFIADRYGFSLPHTYNFSTTADCLRACKELPNLEEGYVGYNPAGIPCVKIKNPAYVAAHHLRGEGLNEKRILDIIIMHEEVEYLTLFPEDENMFEPYTDAYAEMVQSFYTLEKLINEWHFVQMDQKTFAMFFKDMHYSAMAFQIRKGKTWKQTFEGLTQQKKRDLILNYKGGLE